MLALQRNLQKAQMLLMELLKNQRKRKKPFTIDNKKDAVADASSTMAGGEVGSGHSAIAVFEIEPNKPSYKTAINLAEASLFYKKNDLATWFSFASDQGYCNAFDACRA